MNEWVVAGIVVAILSAGWAVVKAVSGIVKPLTEQLTMLNASIRSITDDLNDLSTRNSKTHSRLFESLQDHSEKITEHEIRIVRLEEREKMGVK